MQIFVPNFIGAIFSTLIPTFCSPSFPTDRQTASTKGCDNLEKEMVKYGTYYLVRCLGIEFGRFCFTIILLRANISLDNIQRRIEFPLFHWQRAPVIKLCH